MTTSMLQKTGKRLEVNSKISCWFDGSNYSLSYEDATIAHEILLWESNKVGKWWQTLDAKYLMSYTRSKIFGSLSYVTVRRDRKMERVNGEQDTIAIASAPIKFSTSCKTQKFIIMFARTRMFSYIRKTGQ